MTGVTDDEIVNAFVDLASEIVERQRGNGWNHVALSGDQAIGLIANALLDVAKRLQEGRYGP